MKLDGLRIAPVAGGGLVARFPGVLLIVADAGPAAAEIVAACRAPRESAGRLADRMLALAATLDGVPAFCAVLDSEEGLQAVIHGRGSLDAIVNGERVTLAGHSPQSRIQEPLLGDVTLLSTGAIDPPPFVDLVEGVVPAGGFAAIPRLAPAVAKLAEAPPPPEASADDTIVSNEPIKLADPAHSEMATRVVLAVPTDDSLQKTRILEVPGGLRIEGVRCLNGHFNNPLAGACTACGAGLLTEIVTAPRPSLGRLLVEGGGSYPLESDYVAGRAPNEDPAVQSGVARALAVGIDDKRVSRVHAEIHIEGWTVLIRDRGSANGTFLCPPGYDDWIKLEPNHWVEMTRASRFKLGPATLTYDA